MSPSEGVVERVEGIVHKVACLAALVGDGIGRHYARLVQPNGEGEPHAFASHRGPSVSQLDVLGARHGSLARMFIEITFRGADQSDGALDAAVSGHKTPVNGIGDLQVDVHVFFRFVGEERKKAAALLDEVS